VVRLGGLVPANLSIFSAAVPSVNDRCVVGWRFRYEWLGCWLPGYCGGEGERDRYRSVSGLPGDWLFVAQRLRVLLARPMTRSPCLLRTSFQRQIPRPACGVGVDHSDNISAGSGLSGIGGFVRDRVRDLLPGSPSWSALSQWFLTLTLLASGGSLDRRSARGYGCGTGVGAGIRAQRSGRFKQLVVILH
jgi:hypothetical protein